MVSLSPPESSPQGTVGKSERKWGTWKSHRFPLCEWQADFEVEAGGPANPPVTWKLGAQRMSDKSRLRLPSMVSLGSFGPYAVPELAQGTSNGTICLLASPSGFEGQTGLFPSLRPW